MRLSKEQLDKVKQKYNVNKLYSWSKISCFMTSMYEYYLKYILHKKEDNDNCAYATLGGICHNIIEQLYQNEIKYDEMYDLFEDGFMTAIDIADLKFDRNDEKKNENIKTKYRYNLEHFFKTHKRLDDNYGKIAIEKFVAAKIGNFVLQGYIDAIYKDSDGFYNIIDWKTSSKYSGKTAEEKCGQLIIYAIGLHQLGVPMDKIRICWDFLKYCNIDYQQANGTMKTRTVERIKIGESLQTNAKMWLKKFGYEPDSYLKEMINTNSIDFLPDDVKEKYSVYDCFVYVNITDKLITKWSKTIKDTITDIERRENDYKGMKERGLSEERCSKLFWDSPESVKAESYYYATLCGYSANLILPYKQYLETLDAAKSGEDMFNGVGSDMTDNANNLSEPPFEPDNDIDLSWLDNM